MWVIYGRFSHLFLFFLQTFWIVNLFLTDKNNRFKEGQEDVYDDACSSRPSATTTDENIVGVKKIILDNRRIVELERLLMMLAYGSAYAKQFSRMKRAAAKIVQKLVNFEQK